MKKMLPIIVICFLLFACLTGTKAKSSEGYGDAVVTKINSVYDGDTFRCNIEGYHPVVGKNMPVRIKGIDTPELRDKRKDVKDLAYKAKDFTTKKLQTAKVVRLKNIERGKYFRILADVEVDGKNLGEMLLDNELANPYQGRDKTIWDTIKKKTPGFENAIVYQGKKRHPKWFDRMYEKFCDKFTYWNGKYIELGKRLADVHTLDNNHMVWPIGNPVIFPYEGRVLSVVGKGEILVTSRTGIITHIHGLEGIFVDKQIVPREICQRLIYTGTFDYDTVLGGHKVVPSFIHYKPLTKEQFAEVLNSGVELIEYERVLKDKRGRIYRRSDYVIYAHPDGSKEIRKSAAGSGTEATRKPMPLSSSPG